MVIQKFVTKNECYIYNAPLTVKGLMLHSVGVQQPSAEVFARNWNTFRPNGVQVCVHEFIDTNTGDSYQILPFDRQAWHCAGAMNRTHLGIEMCESETIRYTRTPYSTNPEKARAQAAIAYNAAVNRFAELCIQFKLNPLEPGVIVSHKEGHEMGKASDHGDPDMYWKAIKAPYTMDGFRKSVKAKVDILKGITTNVTPVVVSNAIFEKGKKYNFPITMRGYKSAAEALALKSTGYTVHQPGDYYIYSKTADCINISKSATSPGAWVAVKYTTLAETKPIEPTSTPVASNTLPTFTKGGYYNFPTSMKGYMNAIDAVNGVNSSTTFAEGKYYIYSMTTTAINITKTEGTPGGWVAKKDLKNVTPVPGYLFAVKVIASALNVRDGAGVTYPIVAKVYKGQIFRITEQKNGFGKLYNQKGWISLDSKYTQKV